MLIKYGIVDNNIDVTTICLEKLNNDGIITIPSGDYRRANYFTDPIFGVLKKIFISFDDREEKIYGVEYSIQIDTINNVITTELDVDIHINNVLADIHHKLKIKYGTFSEELSEQKMVVRYLKGPEKVLEIGGNIGRNSMIMASILDDAGCNLVVLESHPYIVKQLEENKNLNQLNFHIEDSALSLKPLIQRNWITIPSDVLLDGYQHVKTITLQQLRQKYNISFDTLVLDCEGAFYHILMDMPDILDGIQLIIMENDYSDIGQKNFINEKLAEHGFSRDYVEALKHHYIQFPCTQNFFEVWKK